MVKSSSVLPSELNNALSNNERASLTDPSEIFTINLKTSSVTLPFSLSFIFLIKLNNSDAFILERSNL